MNLGQLHKALSVLVEQGHSRKPVCINKASFSSRLEEDGAVIIEVASCVGVVFIQNADDDGDLKFNQDGSQSGSYTVVLQGDSNE
jgi:hypothetical protein